MRGSRGGRLLVVAAAAALIAVTGTLSAGQTSKPWSGVLDEHPSIQYAARPTMDRVGRLARSLLERTTTLRRDARTGYLLPLLEALGVTPESQLLVFSKTGIQSAWTSPQNPRALFFDQSVAVGYVPGAPSIELAAQDPQQGVVFYTLDQTNAAPLISRQRSCLTCHVSASTLDVPGMIVRSNTVGDDGKLVPGAAGSDVDHRTTHPDRWGGWYVTSEGAPPPYSQRAHGGNITFSGNGNTSNHVFVDWLSSAPETRGYPSAASDVVALLVFDHQVRAVNLVTRLNWESRVAAADGRSPLASETVRRLANDLADYLLFAGEAPLQVPLIPRPDFARHLGASAPKDRSGRSLGQLDLVRRLMRYPCSYMVYSEAFDALPSAVRHAVYGRMIDVLSGREQRADLAKVSDADRAAVLEILRDTKADFPRSG